MKTLLKIIKYQVRDLSRSKWLLIYTLFFFFLSYGLFSFNDNASRILIGLMNVSFIVIPLVSIVFGTIHFYNNKDYIIFMLSLPIKREQLFLGLYIGLTFPLVLSFVLGILLSFFFGISKVEGHLAELMFLIIAGIFQTLVFSSIAALIAIINENRMMGLGISTFCWLLFAAIYDALFLLVLQYFQDYPLENAAIILSALNPIDLTRLLVVLKLDVSALMGYTGAVFQKFFGSSVGIIVSLLSLIVWTITPLYFGKKIFSKKDF